MLGGGERRPDGFVLAPAERADRDQSAAGLPLGHPVGDGVVLPDHLTTDLASLGQWDYRSDVPVTVLGHIFEQSVTDLEKMRAESRGEPAPR